MIPPELPPESTTHRYMVGTHYREDDAKDSAARLRASGHNVEIIHEDRGLYLPGWEVWIVRHGSGGSLPDSVIFGGGR